MNHPSKSLLWQGFCRLQDTQNQKNTHTNVPLYYYFKNFKYLNYDYL